jgi:hypothetical protein
MILLRPKSVSLIWTLVLSLLVQSRFSGCEDDVSIEKRSTGEVKSWKEGLAVSFSCLRVPSNRDEQCPSYEGAEQQPAPPDRGQKRVSAQNVFTEIWNNETETETETETKT